MNFYLLAILLGASGESDSLHKNVASLLKCAVFTTTAQQVDLM